MGQNQLYFLAIAVVVFVVYRQVRAVLGARKARALLDKGARLLDVRTKEEFASGHLPGALNIPLGELQSRMRELNKDSGWVVYCRSGMRSGTAVAMLKAAGYEQVVNLGPMSALRAG